MRKATSLLFPIAVMAVLAGCAGGGASTSSGGATQLTPPVAAGPAIPAATSAPDTTAALTSQASQLVWQAGSATLGKWIVANTYQCGKAVTSSSTFGFTLVRSGTSCGRNQANPVTSSGALVQLSPGSTYTWTFTYHDKSISGASPGMGRDTDARSLIWQIHGLNEPDTPCTSLNFINGPSNTGGAQMWGLMTCSGLVWSGSYTPGETDNFKIVARISNTSTGYTQLYRNGVLVKSVSGANYHNSAGNPWWNFGPYKWRWELSGGGGSSMYKVNATISGMTLTKS